MSDDFDISQLTDFEQELINLANDTMPKESKKFLRNEGTKLRKGTLAKAKGKVKKVTGAYFKSIKRGKVYDYDGSLSIRCYSSAPHGHLIEYGHRIVNKDGEEVAWKDGYYVFEEAEEEFQPTYFSDCETFIDDVLEKGLK